MEIKLVNVLFFFIIVLCFKCTEVCSAPAAKVSAVILTRRTTLI